MAIYASRLIPAPEEAAWQIISDADGELACWPSIRSIAPLGNGTRQVSTIFGFQFTEAVELQPEKLMRVRILQGPFTGVKTIELEPAGSGTIVKISWDINAGTKMLASLFRWYALRQTRNALERVESMAANHIQKRAG